jgi:hypothetical protein
VPTGFARRRLGQEKKEGPGGQSRGETRRESTYRQGVGTFSWGERGNGSYATRRVIEGAIWMRAFCEGPAAHEHCEGVHLAPHPTRMSGKVFTAVVMELVIRQFLWALSRISRAASTSAGDLTTTCG